MKYSRVVVGGVRKTRMSRRMWRNLISRREKGAFVSREFQKRKEMHSIFSSFRKFRVSLFWEKNRGIPLSASNLWRPVEELRNSQGREGDEHERLRIDDRRMDLRLRHATCRVIEQVLRQTRIAFLSRDDRDDSVIFLARWLYRYRYNSMQWYRRDDWRWMKMIGLVIREVLFF